MKLTSAEKIPNSADQLGVLVIKVPHFSQIATAKKRFEELGYNCASHDDVVDEMTTRSGFSKQERVAWVASRRGRNLVLKRCRERDVDIILTTHRLDNYVPVNFDLGESGCVGFVTCRLEIVSRDGNTLHLGPVTAETRSHTSK